MSFVIAQPEQMQAAAGDLVGIRSSLDEVTAAAATPTTGMLPAAEDEISAAIAALFREFGEEFQDLNVQVAAYHNEFVNLLNNGATAYIEAEVANGAALLRGGGSLAGGLG
ncbi:MAG: PE family protein, partial [Mycobacterium sp.]